MQSLFLHFTSRFASEPQLACPSRFSYPQREPLGIGGKGFRGRSPFLSPSRHCQSTKGNSNYWPKPGNVISASVSFYQRIWRYI